jgi:hypothetical protein
LLRFSIFFFRSIYSYDTLKSASFSLYSSIETIQLKKALLQASYGPKNGKRPLIFLIGFFYAHCQTLSKINQAVFLHESLLNIFHTRVPFPGVVIEAAFLISSELSLLLLFHILPPPQRSERPRHKAALQKVGARLNWPPQVLAICHTANKKRPSPRAAISLGVANCLRRRRILSPKAAAWFYIKTIWCLGRNFPISHTPNSHSLQAHAAPRVEKTPGGQKSLEQKRPTAIICGEKEQKGARDGK